uniref:Alkyl transferase n=2 Tax=Chenopodium quinoa TaxID=63459 RepID=A0A803M9Y2_CHEQI
MQIQVMLTSLKSFVSALVHGAKVPRVLMAEGNEQGDAKQLLRKSYNFFLNCTYKVLSVGPIPEHVAFIMDGNRRYAKMNNIDPEDSHRPGFIALMSVIKHCYELGVKYITIYAFSLHNFRRKPEEIERLMNWMREKIDTFLEDDGFIKRYGVRIYFVGKLEELSEDLQVATNKAMEVTANNTTTYLLVCVAYTSTDEIAHAVEESIPYNVTIRKQENNLATFKIELAELEKQMYMAVGPMPDILVRSSGETRLSNFLLWQTDRCLLYSPSALWPELGLGNLVWAVISFQRHYL